MKINITKKIGDITLQVQVDEKDPRDALFQAGTIASMPTECECGHRDLVLQGNKADGYTFVKVYCPACGSSSNMGEYKDGGVFWKKFEKFVKKENTEINNQENIDDIPF